MSDCPKCGGKMHCPCEHCAERNAGKPLWIWTDGGEVIKCPHCGHAGHANYWMDLDFVKFSLVRMRRIRAAAKAIYYAAHWTPDRECDAGALWTELRDACEFEPGNAPKPADATEATMTTTQETVTTGGTTDPSSSFLEPVK